METNDSKLVASDRCKENPISCVFSFILQRTEGKTKTFIEAEKGICFGCGREQFVLTRIFNTKLCYIDIGSTCWMVESFNELKCRSKISTR